MVATVRRRIEQTHCRALMEWVSYNAARFPELALLHHIPNGGFRRKIEAAILKAMGVKAGVPDYFLPVARHNYHGFYIEMKRKGEKPRAEQLAWHQALDEQGYLVLVADDWQIAAQKIEWYLNGIKKTC